MIHLRHARATAATTVITPADSATNRTTTNSIVSGAATKAISTSVPVHHYGGGFGSAPSSRASSAGAPGAFGYARQGAWSDPADWTPEDERDAATEYGNAPISYRGRGPRGYTRSDERLLEMICERLTDDPRIDARDIEVQVKQQVVTLRGTVDDRRTKYAVEELVEDAGARDIENQLKLRP
jgi:osmotically-inducible protein OsmY